MKLNVKLKIDNVKLWSRFTVALILHFSLYTFHSAIAASRPFAWTAETSRPERMRFEAYHGDAMDFEVAFNALGKPLNIESAGYSATMYWQTNGMETAFWELPCSISGNVARTSFPSSLDPGAKQLHFMLAVSDASNLVYAAEAYVKMLSSPGFAPNAIEMPIRTIDFATIAVTNAPWATGQDIEQASAALRGEIAAKADATGVSTNFTAATGTTNDIWVSDIDGTVLRFTNGMRWVGTGTNSYGFVLPTDVTQTPQLIMYVLMWHQGNNFTLSIVDTEMGEEVGVPVVIDGQQDAVWLDWDTVATNDTLVGRFDNSDYGIHIGPHHLRRYGGVQVSETRVVYTSDLDIATNNIAQATIIDATNRLSTVIAKKADAEKTVEVNTGGASTNLVVRPVYANVNLVIRECETANGQKQYRLIRKED